MSGSPRRRASGASTGSSRPASSAGYSAVVDPARLGWSTLALVELHCEGRMPARAVEAAVRDHGEVVAAYTVAGAASAVLLVRAADTRHLEETLNRIREADGILRTQTSVVLSTLFERRFAPAESLSEPDDPTAASSGDEGSSHRSDAEVIRATGARPAGS